MNEKKSLESNGIATKAMLVRLNISSWSARKYDKKVSMKVAKDYQSKDPGRYNKILIAQEEIRKVTSWSDMARNYAYTNTLPWTDEGYRILPVDSYFEFVKDMGEIVEKHDEAVKKFIPAYPTMVKEAKDNLKSMFSDADYPHPDEIARKFSIKVHFSPIPSGKDFRVSMSQEELVELQVAQDARTKEAVQEATRSLWERLHGVVNHMVERLSKDGKFHDSLVENITELINLLPKLNITGDEKLEEMRREIETKLTKYDPEILRKSQKAKKDTLKEAESILDKMKGFIA